LKIKALCFKIKNHDFSEKSDRPFFKIGHFKNVHFQKTSTTFFLDFFILFIRRLKNINQITFIFLYRGISKQTPTTHPRKQNSITQNHPITQSPNDPMTQSPNDPITQ
jgi:hypothetical protein